jgi:hypothetical protein
MANTRKPTELKLAQGNKGHRPLTPELEPPRGAVGIDRALVSAEAQPHFDRLRSVLEPRGQWSTDSYLAVVQLSELLAEVEDMRGTIRDQGRFIDGRPNSAYVALAAADFRVRMWLQEFGLTDASRAKVKIDPAKPTTHDPLAAYGLN